MRDLTWLRKVQFCIRAAKHVNQEKLKWRKSVENDILFKTDKQNFGKAISASGCVALLVAEIRRIYEHHVNPCKSVIRDGQRAPEAGMETFEAFIIGSCVTQSVLMWIQFSGRTVAKLQLEKKIRKNANNTLKLSFNYCNKILYNFGKAVNLE